MDMKIITSQYSYPSLLCYIKLSCDQYTSQQIVIHANLRIASIEVLVKPVSYQPFQSKKL